MTTLLQNSYLVKKKIGCGTRFQVLNVNFTICLWLNKKQLIELWLTKTNAPSPKSNVYAWFSFFFLKPSQLFRGFIRKTFKGVLFFKVTVLFLPSLLLYFIHILRIMFKHLIKLWTELKMSIKIDIISEHMSPQYCMYA